MTEPDDESDETYDSFMQSITGLMLAIATNRMLTDEEANGLFRLMPDPELQGHFCFGLYQLGLYNDEAET